MNIAEKRRREEEKLSQIIKAYSIPSEAAEKEASTLMHSYYRLCGLSWRLLELESNADVYERRKAYIKKLNDQEARWIDRLQKKFNKYGLMLEWCGPLPHIVRLGDPGGCDVIERYFY